METKALEIRDRHTFIAALAIRMASQDQSENYLLRRSGYPAVEPLVLLARMDADGGPHQVSYDSYSWGPARTMGEAHRYVTEHWQEITSGQVIDVEFILGETTTPKQSEWITSKNNYP